MKERKHFLYFLLENTFGLFYNRHNNVVFRNETGFPVPEDGPLLVVSNHVGTFDPVELLTITKRPIHWVSGAYLFKMRIVGWFFKKVIRCIPKQQGKSDLGTIINIQKYLSKGFVVGIFPEGTRTWDGELVDINYNALAKMAKILKAPVLLVTIEGGFAREPRWVDSRRRGSVNVVARFLATSDYIANNKAQSIAEDFRKYLYFSNDEWKEKIHYSYTSSSRACGLQRLFYMCPVCRKIGTIRTDGNVLECSCCHSRGVLTDNDDIESDSFGFKRMSEWHTWEKEAVAQISEFKEEPGCLFQRGPCDDNVVFETLSKDITVSMKDKSIVIKYNGKTLSVSFSDVTSFILNTRQTMEFITGSFIYRVRLDKNSSSLKYLEYYKALKD